MVLGSHNLTWFGCLRPSSATWWRQPSDRDDPQLHSCTLLGCKRIFEKYVFSTDQLDIIVHKLYLTPAGNLLYSTWLQMNFWEICVFHWVMDIWNCTFPISTIEIENYNGCKSLNMALGSHNLTLFGCLRPSCATWWRHRSGRDDSQLCSCTLPGCKRNLEKYVFYTEYWAISIAFFLSLQRKLKFSNGYNWLIIALGPHKLT